MSDCQPIEFVPASVLDQITQSACAYIEALQPSVPTMSDVQVRAVTQSAWQHPGPRDWTHVCPQVWVTDAVAVVNAINAWFGDDQRTLSHDGSAWRRFLMALVRSLLPSAMQTGWHEDEALPDAWVALTISDNRHHIDVMLGSGIWSGLFPVTAGKAPKAALRTSNVVAGKSVEVSAEIAAIPVSFSELLSLTPGDLLVIDAGALRQVSVKSAGGHTLFSGELGRSNKTLGVKIK